MSMLGRYQLMDRLGEGSMGVIYRAKDLVLEREVALKTLSTSGVKDDELLERFYREARACASLRHPNIVTVYDFGREEGVAYIAMELLEGSDLKKIISGTVAMQLGEKLRIIAAACDGLAHAHGMGIVHRDIKPSNIFLGTDGQPRILDFGVAHVPLSSLTVVGRVLGTPYYMSPEQMLGQACDGRSDIFSMAIVGVEFIAGQLPFRGSPTERLKRDLPDLVLRDRPDIPGEVHAVLQRALVREPADRYASAAEFASALRDIAGRLPSLTMAFEDTHTGLRPAGGTETILSAVLINLHEFEDAADRGDIGVARRAFAEMKRAGAQNSCYVVALEKSAKRLAELESAQVPQLRPLQEKSIANETTYSSHRGSPGFEIQRTEKPLGNQSHDEGLRHSEPHHSIDATELFANPATPVPVSSAKAESIIAPPLPLRPVTPPTLPIRAQATRSLARYEAGTSGRSRRSARASAHSSRAYWAVPVGVLAVAVCVAAFLVMREKDHELVSLPAVTVSSAPNATTRPVESPPPQPSSKPAILPHPARVARPEYTPRAVEAKPGIRVAPVLPMPPLPESIQPQQPITANPQALAEATTAKQIPSPAVAVPPPPTGELALQCLPAECNIAINQKVVGETKNGSLDMHGLDPGDVIVSFAKPGYVEQQLPITVIANKEQSKAVHLKPNLDTQRKAGQQLLHRMLTRLGQVDSPPKLSLSGSANLFTDGHRTDWTIAGDVNFKAQTLSLEIQAGGLEWRTSLKDGATKAKGSGKLKGSVIETEMDWLINAFDAGQPATLAARFKAASAAQIVCDLSTDEQGDRVLQLQAGTDTYALLIAPDGTPLRLHHAGIEVAYADFADVHGYLYPKTYGLRRLAANAPPLVVMRFNTVTAVPTLF
jgi:serine/threonine protein kinase